VRWRNAGCVPIVTRRISASFWGSLRGVLANSEQLTTKHKSVTTHAIREDDTVLLGVQLTSPVQATFAIAFSYALHRDFLNEVADAGSLVFATTDTETAHEERPLWLSVNIDGSALRQTLQINDD